jgi:hypothetical protein
MFRPLLPRTQIRERSKQNQSIGNVKSLENCRRRIDEALEEVTDLGSDKSV